MVQRAKQKDLIRIGWSDAFECCLHGRACRAGQKLAEDKEEKEDLEEQYVNLAYSKSQRKSQQDGVGRLTRQLRHAEQQVERHQRRREEGRRESSGGESRLEPLKESTDSDISYKQLDEYKRSGRSGHYTSKGSCGFSRGRAPRRGDECCEMNRTVNVSVPRTPLRDITGFKLRTEENQMASEEDSDRNRRRILKESKTENLKEPDNYSDLAKSIYLGVCNFSKAEEMVEKRADFRLYHQMIQNPLLDDLEPQLPLHLVYKTANGSYRHYPVRTRSVLDSTYFYVETGEKRPINHCNLNHLVRYYQINAQRHPDHQDYADPFPWWEVPS